MNTLPMRIFGLAVTLVSLYGIYYNWQLLLNESQYWFKLGFFAPFGVVGGLFLMLFPAMGGKPETRQEIIAVSIMFVIGVAAGLVNSYLMNADFLR